MGFFSDIKDKIFNRHHETETVAIETRAEAPVAAEAPAAPAAPVPTSPAATPTAQPVAPTGASAPAAQSVDVASILDDAVTKGGQPLNWRTSIVDLMKALGIDSSLASRKELAQELDYTGDTSDSVTMNIWLHKQVLAKLAANGGSVPPELLD